MRKWLGIGMLSVAAMIRVGAIVGVVTAVGVGAYWYFTRTSGWTARHAPGVQEVRVENGKNDGDAEPSEVIEPLVVQQQHNTPAPEGIDGAEFGVELPRVALEPGMQQQPRPDVEPDRAERMPYADEKPVIGVWSFLDWSALKANLSKLNLFKEIEKAAPVEESEDKQTNSPTENPQPDPVPDYHQQYQHCPRYDGPCQAPYRSMPRD